jgi:hypothetical protein
MVKDYRLLNSFFIPITCPTITFGYCLEQVSFVQHGRPTHENHKTNLGTSLDNIKSPFTVTRYRLPRLRWLMSIASVHPLYLLLHPGLGWAGNRRKGPDKWPIFGRFLTLFPLKRPARREKNTSNMADVRRWRHRVTSLQVLYMNRYQRPPFTLHW